MLFLYALNVHLFVPTTKIRLFVGISSYSCHKETKKVVCYLNLAKCRCGKQYY